MTSTDDSSKVVDRLRSTPQGRSALGHFVAARRLEEHGTSEIGLVGAVQQSIDSKTAVALMGEMHRFAQQGMARATAGLEAREAATQEIGDVLEIDGADLRSTISVLDSELDALSRPELVVLEAGTSAGGAGTLSQA